MRRLFQYALFLIVLSPGFLHAEGKRTALVIGNARYEAAAGPLRNPVNDAKEVAKSLRALGFSVIEKQDLTRDQMLRALSQFRATLSGAEVSVFYYSGHGITVGGSNYLIPIKSEFNPEGIDTIGLRLMAETRLFNAEQAVADMSVNKTGCNLLILDACRTTPMARDGQSRDASVRGGLAEMNPPAGSLIAFSTDAGLTASDGEGTNGLYTEELLKNLQTPGLTVEQVFKRTRAAVMRRSDGGQIPAEYSRLIGEDVFLAGKTPLIPRAVALSREERLSEILKMAKKGQADAVMDGLEKLTQSAGFAEDVIPSIEALLTYVKEDLSAPTPNAESDLVMCNVILEKLPKCLAKDSAPLRQLTAKAASRKGDALMLLKDPSKALESYDLAKQNSPEDPYILFNRGNALAALGRKEEARVEYRAVLARANRKSNAYGLAKKALVNVDRADF